MPAPQRVLLAAASKHGPGARPPSVPSAGAICRRERGYDPFITLTALMSWLA
jgi:hypothetical protein